MGPTVSIVGEIGITPDRLKLPVVGFRPTTEVADDGESIDPEVSDPTAATAKPAATAAPLPELDPPVLNASLP
jgi:hypothetical protein